MLEKITVQARFFAIKAEEFYEQALQKTGPAKEKALEITTKTIAEIKHKQIEIKKYTNEMSKTAEFKFTEWKKSIDFSRCLNQLIDNANKNYQHAATCLAKMTPYLQKVTGKKFTW